MNTIYKNDIILSAKTPRSAVWTMLPFRNCAVEKTVLGVGGNGRPSAVDLSSGLCYTVRRVEWQVPDAKKECISREIYATEEFTDKKSNLLKKGNVAKL